MSKDVYIDTETTGFTPRLAKIIEVAAVYVVDGKVVDEYSALANPGEEVLADLSIDRALEVNKITRDMLRQALPTAQVAEALQRFLARCDEGEPATYTAFNVAFDAKFLEVEPWSINRERFGECVMMAAAAVMDPYRKRFAKLSAAAEYFACEWDGDAHRATADARMAAKIHQVIRGRRAADAF